MFSLLEELGYVYLVSEDVVGYSRRYQQADDACDAAAEFYDGGLAGEDLVDDEGVGG